MVVTAVRFRFRTCERRADETENNFCEINKDEHDFGNSTNAPSNNHIIFIFISGKIYIKCGETIETFITTEPTEPSEPSKRGNKSNETSINIHGTASARKIHFVAEHRRGMLRVDEHHTRCGRGQGYVCVRLRQHNDRQHGENLPMHESMR